MRGFRGHYVSELPLQVIGEWKQSHLNMRAGPIRATSVFKTEYHYIVKEQSGDALHVIIIDSTVLSAPTCRDVKNHYVCSVNFEAVAVRTSSVTT